MSTEEKLYQSLKHNPKNARFEDIERLLTSVGFVRRDTKGSHRFFSHPHLKGIDDYVNIPFERPIKLPYVRKALKMYEKALELI